MKEWNPPLKGLAPGLLLALPWLYPLASGPSPGVQQWLISVACGVLLWLLRTDLTPERVLRAWVYSASISAVIALLQYAGQAHFLTPWVADAAQGEAYGNLRQRNQFATLGNIGLAALLWLPSLEQDRHSGARPWMHVLAALLGAANAASGSRTGLAQMVMLTGLLMLWGLWKDRTIRQLLMAAVVAYAISSLMLPVLSAQHGVGGGIWGRLLQVGATCSSRIALWSNVLELITSRPWGGLGLGRTGLCTFCLSV